MLAAPDILRGCICNMGWGWPSLCFLSQAASFTRAKMRHLLHKISRFRRVSGRPQISV